MRNGNKVDGMCWSSESGVTIVYIAGIIAVLFVILVFSIDIGWMTLARNEGQAAVDASALAAAAALPSFNKDGDLEDLENMASLFNSSNTVGDHESGINVNHIDLFHYDNGEMTSISVDTVDFEYPFANAVRVKKKFTVPLLMARMLKHFSWDVEVAATAVLGGPGCAEPDIPLTLVNCSDDTTALCSPSRCEEEIILSFGTQANSNSDNSAFYDFIWTDEADNSSASECKAFAASGSGGIELCNGHLIALNNGQVNSCLKELQLRFNEIGEIPWKVTVPVVNMDCSTEPNGVVTVAGFAKMAIVEIKATGSPKYVKFKRLCAEQADDTLGGGMLCGLRAEQPLLVQ